MKGSKSIDRFRSNLHFVYFADSNLINRLIKQYPNKIGNTLIGLYYNLIFNYDILLIPNDCVLHYLRQGLDHAAIFIIINNPDRRCVRLKSDVGVNDLVAKLTFSVIDGCQSLLGPANVLTTVVWDRGPDTESDAAGLTISAADPIASA